MTRRTDAKSKQSKDQNKQTMKHPRGNLFGCQRGNLADLESGHVRICRIDQGVIQCKQFWQRLGCRQRREQAERKSILEDEKREKRKDEKRKKRRGRREEEEEEEEKRRDD